MIFESIIFMGFLGSVVAVVANKLLLSQKEAHLLKSIAGALGLEVDLEQRLVFGTRDEVGFSLRSDDRGRTFQLKVSLGRFLPMNVHILPRSMMHALFAEIEVKSGDVDFDRRFHVMGPPLLMRAALDARARSICSTLDLTIQWREIRRTPDLDRASFDPLIDQLVYVAKRLQTHETELPELLFATFEHEPSAGARRCQLELLLGTKLREDAVARALSDEDPEVRGLAAEHAGEAGRPICEALFRDPTVSDELRARVGAHVVRVLPRAEVYALLETAGPKTRLLIAQELDMLGGGHLALTAGGDAHGALSVHDTEGALSKPEES